MPIYNLDRNSSYGLLPEVEAELALQLNYLNPNALHQEGQKARAAIEEARVSVLKLLGISKNYRVVFTSGATEANNQAIFWQFQSHLQKTENSAERSKLGFLTSTIEHPCVLEPCRKLLDFGFSGKFLTVNEQGRFDPAELDAAASKFEPVFASVMAVNNETGQIIDFQSTFKKLKNNFPEILTHSDLVQAAGKLDFNFAESNLDLATISGHKIGALTGIGALIVSEELEAQPYLFGGPQESRYRAGTQNVLGIISLGIAARVILQRKEQRVLQLENITETFTQRINALVPDVIINNAQLCKVPGVLSVRFKGVSAQDLLVALDLNGVLVSAGSACASGKPLPSYVLMALGLSEAEARESLRLSFSAEQSVEEALAAAEITARCVEQIRVSRAQCSNVENSQA